MSDTPPTRRQLLARALYGSVVACVGTAVAPLSDPERALGAGPVTDANLVQGLIGAELLAAAVYDHVLATGLLSGRSERAAHGLLAHEHAHAAALQTELRILGSAAPAGPADTKAIQTALSDHHVTRSLTDLHRERDCLDLLLDLENLMEGAYYQAMSKLVRPRLLTLGAQILASEAQHYALLGELRRHKDFSRAVPYAFVEGRY